jgi:hypothetical protein
MIVRLMASFKGKIKVDRGLRPPKNWKNVKRPPKPRASQILFSTRVAV